MHNGGFDRRDILRAAALLAFSAQTGGARAQQRIPIADMHSHLGLIARSPNDAAFAAELRAQRVALVAWALPADSQWIRQTESGVSQTGVPPAGALSAFLEPRLERMKARALRVGLRVVLTRADIDACIAGDSGVVLSAEGADFLEGKLDGLKTACDKGLRHLQLVHYIDNPVGDYQTKPPTHNGLTRFGQELVEACNAQGVLVDLAHSPGTSIDQALEVSKAPMIFSHGWVDSSEGRHVDRFSFQQRRLSLQHAKKIAAKGGVVGLWGLGLIRPAAPAEAGRGGWTVGRQDTLGYARELASLIDRLGADHVALGTDIEGVGDNWSVNNYSQVREVIDHLQKMSLPTDVVERVAGGNYARVLRAALNA